MVKNMKESLFTIKKGSFRWVLFLGVIPFDKAVLTLYQSRQIGNVISYLLNLFVLVYAVLALLQYGNTIAECKKILINKMNIVFIIMSTLYLFSGLLNDNLQFSRFASLLCLWAYYIYSFIAYKNSRELIRDISKAASFLVLISLILYFVNNRNVYYQESAIVYSFKGVALNRNGFVEFALLPIAYYWYTAIENGRKQKTVSVIMILTIAYSILITKSATSIICLSVLLILLVFRKGMKQVFTLKLFYMVYAILFAVIVVINSSDSWLLQRLSLIFGKSSTLTGRTSFWPIAMDLISNKPLFGYGIDTTILMENGIIENDPHNGILFLLLTSGILGTFLFLKIIISTLNKVSGMLIKNEYVYCIIAFVIAWLVRGLVESAFSYSHFMFWVSVAISLHIYYESFINECRTNYEQ